MYKHLMIISDGENLENSLHLTDRSRAETLIQWTKDNELEDELAEVMAEADEEAAQADYPEGVPTPSALDPEDYVEPIKEMLAANDIDVYLDELAVPEAVMSS